MKRLMALAIVLAVAPALGGCTIDKERIAAWAQSVRQGLQVTAEATREVLDQVCAQEAAVVSGAQIAISIAQSRATGPGPHPKTERAIRDINTAISAFRGACTSGSASTGSLASLALRAWNAYQAVMAAQAAAQAANGA